MPYPNNNAASEKEPLLPQHPPPPYSSSSRDQILIGRRSRASSIDTLLTLSDSGTVPPTPSRTVYQIVRDPPQQQLQNNPEPPSIIPTFDPVPPPPTYNDPEEALQKPSQKRRNICSSKCVKVVIIILVMLLLAQPIIGFWMGLLGNTNPSSPDMDVGLRPMPGCPPINHVKKAAFSFDEPHFSLRQHSSVHAPLAKRINGRVIVVPGKEDQSSAIEAMVVYGSADLGTLDLVKFDASHASLDIDTASYSRGYTTDIPQLCLGIDVYLSVLPGTKMDGITADLENLGMDFKHGLSLNITGSTSVTARSSSVTSEESSSFNSRHTIINVESGSISGEFALLDLLLISTKSGSISVDVVPKEESRDRPEPAQFTAQSTSGSVHANVKTGGNIPRRDYRTEIMSGSGSVGGTFLHGTKTILRSSSGSINAEITPVYVDSRSTTTLTSEGHSGQTTLTLHEPIGKSSSIIDNMQSRHISMSGSLTLHYPRQWEGKIEGSVMSGSLNLHGSNLHIIEEHKLGPTHRIRAVKGDGDGRGKSYMTFETVSGSANLQMD